VHFADGIIKEYKVSLKIQFNITIFDVFNNGSVFFFALS